MLYTIFDAIYDKYSQNFNDSYLSIDKDCFRGYNSRGGYQYDDRNTNTQYGHESAGQFVFGARGGDITSGRRMGGYRDDRSGYDEQYSSDSGRKPPPLMTDMNRGGKQEWFQSVNHTQEIPHTNPKADAYI